MKSIILITVLLFSFYSFIQAQTNYSTGEVLLKINTPFTSIQQINGKIQTEQNWFNYISEIISCYQVDPIFDSDWGEMEKFYVCKFNGNFTVDSVIQIFSNESNVQKAWANEIGQYCSNDPLFNQQWGLLKIQAPEAWNIESGNSSVIIGIIDSGVDLGVRSPPSSLEPHPDLEANLWNINGNYGIDILNEEEPPYDDFGHGTRVTGIAGAVTNNSLGIAGTAGGGINSNSGVTILMLKISPENLKEDKIAKAIVKAIDEQVKVINMSIGLTWKDECEQNYDSPFDALNEAILYAINSDVIIVAAIGNNLGDLTPRCPVPYWLVYPAAHPDVISVAGLGIDDIKSPSSNFADWCDLSAPGTDILSTYPIFMDTEPPIGYSLGTGTSFAAPFVSGVAALIRSIAPEANVEMVRAILRQTTDNIDAVNEGFSWGGKIGSGRLNAFNALSLIQNDPDRPTGISVHYSGIHPIITWNKNYEADVKGYNLHAKYEFRNGTDPKNWTYTEEDYFVTDTTYLDANWYRSGNDVAYYWVYAVDIIDNWSSKSNTVWIEGSLGKSSENLNLTNTNFVISAYPNPFNNQLTLQLDIPSREDIFLQIYNIQGQIVRQFRKVVSYPGSYKFVWDGKNSEGIDLPSGIYFTKLEGHSNLLPQKVILLK